MGCGPSKRTLETVDDSVHVMIAHDKKVAAKKGQPASSGYRPRAEHPLLHQQQQLPAGGGGGGGGTETNDAKNNDGI
jgi:hypothetical protein